MRLAEPGSLEFWLIERYMLYSYGNGNLFSGRVVHAPYKISTATLQQLTTELPGINGFHELGDPIPQVQYAPSVSVEVFPLLKANC